MITMLKMTGYMTGTAIILVPCVLFSTGIDRANLHALGEEDAKTTPVIRPVSNHECFQHAAEAGDSGQVPPGHTDGKGDLGCALAFFRAGNPETTLAMTAISEVNPWLETYRVFVRSGSFKELGRKDREREELAGFFADEGMIGIIRDHHLFGKLLDAFVESSLEDPAWEIPEHLTGDMLRSLSGKNLLRIFAGMTASGKGAENNAFLMEALKRDFGDDATEILEKQVVDEILNVQKVLSREEAILVTKKTIACGLWRSSEKMFAFMQERGVSIWDIKSLKASFFERKGDLPEASRAYHEIFRSDAPTENKKEALIRIAAIDDKMNRAPESAEHYRLFAMYYPDDDRAERCLDTSARIMIARKEWEKAIRTWDVIRQRGPRTYTGKTALLGEAVLLYRLDRKEKSIDILKGLLPDAGRRLEAAVLYWLFRAGEGTPETVTWKKNLEERHPHSFYNRALGREKGYLGLDMGCRIPASVVDSMEAREMKEFDSIDTLKQERSKISDHPAWEGFMYFIKRDLVEDAGECARTLSALFGDDGKSLLMLFRETRRHGMIDLSTRLLSRYPLLSSEMMIPANLLFPVAYAGFVGENVERYQVPPDLVLGVIREESSFNSRAVSRAGAMGLMQLMPSTCKWIAGKLKVAEVSAVLFDPAFNIEAGTWYLRFLLDRNGGSFVGALASYNAGSSRMSAWRNTFVPSEDPMAAIEMIGIEETREYVRRVLESMAVYRSFYLDGGRYACD